MPSPIRRLTDISIRNLKPRVKRYEVPDPGASNLYVSVGLSGKKSYVVRYRHGVPLKTHKLTLPSGISLAAARKLAADAMHEVAQGRDPSETRKAAKAKAVRAQADTFEAICTEYMAREGRKLRTAADREATLRRHVIPTFGNRPIGSIKRSEIVRLLDRIEDGSGQRSADLALSYMRKIMNWHSARDDDFRSPIISGMGRWSVAEHARSRVLSDDELRKVWKATDATGHLGAYVKFLLLSGCRRGEAAGLTWDEIDGDLWNLPGARNKTKVDFTRPLSKAALSLIQEQPRLGRYVFSFNGQNPAAHNTAKSKIQRHANIANNWRLHDLRRTARTLLSRAGISPDVAERCLGHAIPGVRGIYDRHRYGPEMAHAFEALSAEIERIINPPAGAVVPLRRRKR